MISFKNNECFQCEFFHYLSYDNRCLELSSNSNLQIRGCNDYRRNDECYVCNRNNYRKSRLCRPIKENIKDCTVYESQNKCNICDLKLPSLDRKTCEVVGAPETFPHCLFFNNPLTCEKCKPGFKKN